MAVTTSGQQLEMAKYTFFLEEKRREKKEEGKNIIDNRGRLKRGHTHTHTIPNSYGSRSTTSRNKQVTFIRLLLDVTVAKRRGGGEQEL